ncbi:MAG: hypothetical protein EOM54_01165 [Clostridia bacterium]|nr:hypothetical protein [Clostridia bacterium]
MAIRPKEVYKGKHKRRNIIAILLFLVAVLIVGAVLMFYSFQKYLVYGQEGVSLELPILATPAPTNEAGETTDFEEVDAELVVEQPDYSGVAATAGEDLPDMRALFVPAEKLSDEGIGTYAALMETYGANALLLEVKPESGQLAYASTAATAESYGLSGTYDLQTEVTALKEQGVYLAAMISCCVDDLLATRNSFIALRNSYGGVYTDSAGMWLDPYNGTVRDYIKDLALELAQMGFDEIVLKDFAHPVTDSELVYSETMSFAPTPLAGISGFAVSLSSALEESGATLSVVLTSDTIANGLAEKTGQDEELFFKVFDRVCCWADSAWQHGVNLDSLSSYITVGDASQRFLPIISYAPEDATSWIVVVPAEVLGGGE